MRTLRILTLIGVMVLGSIWALPLEQAQARGVPKPKIASLTVAPARVGALFGSSTISATVSSAASCQFSSIPALLQGIGGVGCSGGTVSQKLTFPENSSAKAIVYRITLTATGPGGLHAKSISVKVLPGAGGAPPVAASALASDHDGSDCAIVATTGVDCWGLGNWGQLGDGKFYLTGNESSATPVQVTGVGGQGTLSGATALVAVGPGSGDNHASDFFCALVASGAVDCWGGGHTSPVPVSGVGGTGILSGVETIVGGSDSFCAILTSHEVVCWGGGSYGQLGNGSFVGSTAPVQVVGVGGSGVLTGVVSLTSESPGTYCAIVVFDHVACWGAGADGQLGNGAFYPVGNLGSATAVLVVGTGGTGDLSGVTFLKGGADGAGTICAILTTSGVACWGWGLYGELGNGTFGSSASPVTVVGLGGTGNLTGVVSLSESEGTMCAILTTTGVDCWGIGNDGELGDGGSSPGVHDTSTPVQVEGVGGAGVLTGVVTLATPSTPSFCAVLSGGGADCWGYGKDGELGNGVYYPGNQGSATPVVVEGLGGSGVLGGVQSLTGSYDAVCGIVASGGVDCWGYGLEGELGNGMTSSSSTPVAVLLS
jgi:alpha-tubulin suppressor-like RCC1 family protein